MVTLDQVDPGQKPPSTIPEIFAPGILPNPGKFMDWDLTVSPDGKRLIFSSKRPFEKITNKTRKLWKTRKQKSQKGFGLYQSFFFFGI